MLTAVKYEAKKRKNVFLLVGLFILFLGLYIFLDFEGNTNYNEMTESFGLLVVLIHISVNIAIAILSAIMVGFSIINYNLTKIDPKGSNAIPFFTFIFGLLTFGCTGCVVAFLSAVGIAFSPLVLPAGNLIWKLVALLFVALGFFWIMYSIEHMKCRINNVEE
ncbi:MAG: hypothetical protein KAJ22_02815 [Candidatus Izimaplasma sp.]|nr:hypothetical protein [Candidatus Izimaplasma bacterium]